MEVTKVRSTRDPLTKIIIIVVVVIVLCGVSFYGGYAYEKGHKTQTTSVSSTDKNGFGGGGGFGSGFGGPRGSRDIGSVTAVSSSSITITNNQTNASQTFSITSSTVIDDNGQTVTSSDIQTGDTVFITTSSSTSTQAERILVNPSFGGGQGSTATPSTDSSE